MFPEIKWPAIRHERRSVLESLQPAAIHTYVSTIAGRVVRGACLKVSSQMDVFASLNSSAHRFAVLSWAAVSAAVASSRLLEAWSEDLLFLSS